MKDENELDDAEFAEKYKKTLGMKCSIRLVKSKMKFKPKSATNLSVADANDDAKSWSESSLGNISGDDRYNEYEDENELSSTLYYSSSSDFHQTSGNGQPLRKKVRFKPGVTYIPYRELSEHNTDSGKKFAKDLVKKYKNECQMCNVKARSNITELLQNGIAEEKEISCLDLRGSQLSSNECWDPLSTVFNIFIVHGLDLTGSILSKTALISLRNVLQNVDTIKKLNLKKCLFIKDGSVCNIIQDIICTSNLISINLTGINFAQYDITSQSLNLQNIQYIKTLYLCDCNLAKNSLSVIGCFPGLKKLMLRNNMIESIHCNALKSILLTIKNLQVLNLSLNPLMEEGISKLFSSPSSEYLMNLKKLYLVKVRGTVSGFSSMKTFMVKRKIERLCLSENEGLEIQNLFWNSSPDGEDKTEYVTTLKSLFLRKLIITDIFNIGKLVEKNPNLAYIDMRQNAYPPETRRCLEKTMKSGSKIANFRILNEVIDEDEKPIVKLVPEIKVPEVKPKNRSLSARMSIRLSGSIHSRLSLSDPNLPKTEEKSIENFSKMFQDSDCSDDSCYHDDLCHVVKAPTIELEEEEKMKVKRLTSTILRGTNSIRKMMSLRKPRTKEDSINNGDSRPSSSPSS